MGLQTLLPSVLTLVQNRYVSLPELFRLISYNPAKILKQPTGTIKNGSPADIIVFDKNKPFVLDRFKLLSKSKNTPFDEAKMQILLPHPLKDQTQRLLLWFLDVVL